MCCITTLLLVLLSRLGILYWWLTNPQSHNLPYVNWILPLPGWLWTLLGAIFLPWTTLAYLFVYPGGVTGIKWVVLGIAFLIDMASHGGSYRHRNRVYRRRQMRI
jgi:hypothetical protein